MRSTSKDVLSPKESSRRGRVTGFGEEGEERPPVPTLPPPLRSVVLPDCSSPAPTGPTLTAVEAYREGKGGPAGTGYAETVAWSTWARRVADDLTALRNSFSLSRDAFKFYAENGVTFNHMETFMRSKASEVEVASRVEHLRKELRVGLTERPTNDKLHAQLERKVDWDRFHDAVATYTEKTVGDFVYAHLKEIKKEINDSIQKVFDVDPSLRADMSEVRRLAKKIESAELATHRLHKLVEDGYDERMKQAEGRLGELVDVSLNRFTSHATAQRDTIMGAVESAAAGLEGRVNKRLKDFDSDARQVLDGVQHQMASKVAAIEKRLADRFDSQFAAVEKRLSGCESDAANAKKNIDELKRGLKDTNALVSKLNEEVQGIVGNIMKLQATIENMNAATEQLKGEQQKMKGEIAANTKAIKNIYAIISKMTLKLDRCDKNLHQLKAETAEHFETMEKSTATSVSELKMSTARLGSDLRSAEESLTRSISSGQKQLTMEINLLSSQLDIRGRELDERINRMTQRLEDKIISLRHPIKGLQQTLAAVDKQHNSQHWDLRARMAQSLLDINQSLAAVREAPVVAAPTIVAPSSVEKPALVVEADQLLTSRRAAESAVELRAAALEELDSQHTDAPSDASAGVDWPRTNVEAIINSAIAEALLPLRAALDAVTASNRRAESKLDDVSQSVGDLWTSVRDVSGAVSAVKASVEPSRATPAISHVAVSRAPTVTVHDDSNEDDEDILSVQAMIDEGVAGLEGIDVEFQPPRLSLPSISLSTPGITPHTPVATRGGSVQTFKAFDSPGSSPLPPDMSVSVVSRALPDPPPPVKSVPSPVTQPRTLLPAKLTDDDMRPVSRGHTSMPISGFMTPLQSTAAASSVSQSPPQPTTVSSTVTATGSHSSLGGHNRGKVTVGRALAPVSPFSVQPLASPPGPRDVEGLAVTGSSPAAAPPSASVGGVTAAALARTMGMMLHAANNARARPNAAYAAPKPVVQAVEGEPKSPEDSSPANARMAMLATRQDSVTDRMRGRARK